MGEKGGLLLTAGCQLPAGMGGGMLIWKITILQPP